MSYDKSANNIDIKFHCSKPFLETRRKRNCQIWSNAGGEYRKFMKQKGLKFPKTNA